MMRILYLITARGGSKGVPDKNLQLIEGLSLVGFKAKSALKSRTCTRLVISTDSGRIQADAKCHGVEVPFTRPAELASDGAKSSDVIKHAIDWFEQNGDRYDAIVLLEPSAPFARAEDYDGAVALMERTGANAVVGVRRMEVSSVFVGPLDERGRISEIVRRMKANSGVLRQEMKPEYTMNGALYVFKWDYFKQHQNIYYDEAGVYGYVMPDELSIEIDELRDLHFARFLAQSGHVDMRNWRNGR